MSRRYYLISIIAAIALPGCAKDQGPAGPPPHVSLTINAMSIDTGRTECYIVWRGESDQRVRIHYHVRADNRARTLNVFRDSGYFRDTVRFGADFQGGGLDLPWDLVWEFLPADSETTFGRATIHPDCTPHICDWRTQDYC